MESPLNRVRPAARRVGAMGIAVLVIAAGLALPVAAAEGEGCAAAAWSLDADGAALAAPGLAQVNTGASRDGAAPQAFVLKLAPADIARLPAAPERAAKAGTFSGYVTLTPPAGGGLVQVTLAAAAWIDLISDGTPLKSAAFTGVQNCPLARKSVRFLVPAAGGALLLQLSGVERDAIGIALSTPQ